MTAEQSVAIIGGGVAGVAAAVRLAEAGIPSVLYEKSARLGGRASSFADKESGDEIDCGQHILMGCCTELIDLYRRLGTYEHVRWQKKILFADEWGDRHVVSAMTILPPPLYLAPSLVVGRLIPPEELYASAKFVMAIRRAERIPERLRMISAARWLAEEGQSGKALLRVWEPLIVSAINASLDRIAASEAWFFIKIALLSDAEQFSLGVPTLPLSRMIEPVAERFPLVEVRLRAPVSAVSTDGRFVTAARRRHEHDAVISTAPPWSLPKGIAVEGEFVAEPIVGARLKYDAPVMDVENICVVGRPTHWFYARPAPDGSQSIAAVRSAATAAVRYPPKRIIDETLEDLAVLFPRAKEGSLVSKTVIKMPRATFLPSIGLKRPGAVTACERILLAGEWTDTGWPSTMEGAARSGRIAADAWISRSRSSP